MTERNLRDSEIPGWLGVVLTGGTFVADAWHSPFDGGSGGQRSPIECKSRHFPAWAAEQISPKTSHTIQTVTSVEDVGSRGVSPPEDAP